MKLNDLEVDKYPWKVVTVHSGARVDLGKIEEHDYYIIQNEETGETYKGFDGKTLVLKYKNVALENASLLNAKLFTCSI